MDAKTKNKIINALRRLSFAHGPRNKAKNKQKVDKATFRCLHCKRLFYEGSSDKNFKEIQSRWDEEIIKGKLTLDHEPPVIPVEGFDSWDGVLNRMFCDENGWQGICKECDKIKTDVEKTLRMKHRREKKK